VYGTDPGILVYTDNILHAPGSNVVEIALQRMGLAYTVEYGSPANFNQLLSGGTWDLVIIDMSHSLMVFDDVEAYVIAGGTLILSYWDIDGSSGGTSTLWPLLGVVPTQDVFSTPPIYRWDLSHSLFNQPNTVPDFTSRVDTVNDNGDKFAAVAGAALLAGYTPTVQPGEGGLLLSAAYPAIVHGFLPGENPADLDGDSILDAVELYENEIEYLLGGANWLSVEPDRGILASGESIDLSVVFDATDLISGNYDANIVVASNDPDEAEITIPTTLTVTGVPLIAVEPASLDFASVYLTQSNTLQLTVSNPGTQALEVTGIASDDGQFTADLTAFTVELLQEQIVNVTFLAATPGAIEASLTLSHNAGEGTTVVPMTATAVVPPEIAVVLTPLEAAAMPGGQKVKTLTVCNEGGSDLDFSVASELSVASVPVFNPEEVEKGADYDLPGVLGSGGPDAFGYSWMDSDEPGGPVFNWVDISATGTPLFSRSQDDANRGPNPIGFTFPFYGNDFTEFRVCSNGWISFTSSWVDFSNAPLPGHGAPKNLLAVFHDDLRVDPDDGSQVFWEFDGEKLIVQFDNVPRLGFGGPYTFQALLYPTGTIVYQYLSMQGTRLDEATIGIQNATRDDGLTIVYDADYVHDNLAIRIGTPPEWLSVEPSSGVVPPGECVDLTVTFDASELGTGDYTGNLTLASNDITNPMVDVPVLFHVGTIDATDVDATPSTLNVTSNGMWVKVRVELPVGYDPADVLLETVLLNGIVPADPKGFKFDEDFNVNGIPDLSFDFDRSAVAALLPAGESVAVVVTGEVADTTWFVATDYIRVINPSLKTPNGGEVLAAGGSYPLTWDNPAGWNVTHADLFWTPDDGETWYEIATNVQGTSMSWDVPADMSTENARLRVFVYDDSGVLGFDTSDQVFEVTAVVTDAPSSTRPRTFALAQNSPNPFNPRTTIRFDLPRDENVRILIYDVKGRLVKTLVSEPMTYGTHEAIWDGDDNQGNRVATGVYYYRIVAGSFTATKNMVLVK
jgi:hypothetical protein